MSRISTSIPRILLDWQLQPEMRKDVSEEAWRRGVTTELQNLFTVPPCTTSRIILTAIALSGKDVTIAPAKKPKDDEDTSLTGADDWATATAQGKPQHGSGAAGKGGGSSATVFFTAQDYEPSTQGASLEAADEALLHELVHALRDVRGLADSSRVTAPLAALRRGDDSEVVFDKHGNLDPSDPKNKEGLYSQVYGELEEFVAIVITNIYRSENRRQDLRRDHTPTRRKNPVRKIVLMPPLSNARNFMTVWRPKIEQFCGEMRDICDRIAVIDCHFNPVFELYSAQGRFVTGKRVVAV